MKHHLVFIWFMLLALVSSVTAAEPAYNYASFLSQSELKIPNSYTPFGNYPTFGRIGDDGSRCVVDPNGVLTWVDSTGVVRLLPDTELAVPLFVTNTECVVWNNRFADYNDAYSRPTAQIVYFKAVAGSSDVTSQVVNAQGTEVVATSPITTTTGTLNFVTLSRKVNDDVADVLERRVYRLTFNGGVQLVNGSSGYVIRDAASGVKHNAVGYGSDGSMVFHVDDELLYVGDGKYNILGRIYYWVNGSGNVLKMTDVLATDPPLINTDTVGFNRCIFTSSTRIVFEKIVSREPQLWDLRRSAQSGVLTSATEITGVTGITMDSSYYTQAGVNRYFYTVEQNLPAVVVDDPDTTDVIETLPAIPGDPRIVRTYQLTDAGVNAAFTRVQTLPDPVSAATIVGAVNPQDGAALLYSEDGANSVWLHSGTAPNNISVIPNSSVVKPLYVTDEQCVLWENARAAVNGNGALPPVDVIHYIRNTGTNALTPTDVFVGGNALLNTSPYTPDFPYWLLTTAEKTQPDTAILRSYRLTSLSTTDRDNDGLLDLNENGTGIYVSSAQTGTHMNNPDSDGDGILDGDEVFPFVMVVGEFTWAEAKADAEANGGRLATINTADDYAALQRKFAGKSFFSQWLGATDEAAEGTWTWFPRKYPDPTDPAEPFNTPNLPYLAPPIPQLPLAPIPLPWAAGEPNNSSNSDGLVLQSNFKWADARLIETHGYLMERPWSDPNKNDSDNEPLVVLPRVNLTDSMEITFKSNPNDLDTDNDLLSDLLEFEAGTDPNNPDTDGDTLSDFDELDVTDVSPVKYAYITDPLLKDTDLDGLDDNLEYVEGTDPTDVDTDNDELSDYYEVMTGKPPLNPGDPDSPDRCDPLDEDTDDDGLLDGKEVNTYKTKPNNPDTDGDDLKDSEEVEKGTDPLDPDDPKNIDSDDDGLTNYEEIFVYTHYYDHDKDPLTPEVLGTTDPLIADTDFDGLSDYEEVNGTYNGIIFGSTNPLVADTDGDGFTDYEEVTAEPFTDPLDETKFPDYTSSGLYDSAEPTGSSEVSIDLTYGPFGHRPDTDKTSEDGSVAIRDLNGAIIWVDNLGTASVLPNSALAKTLYVSNTECVVWANRYDFDYNARGSESLVVIHRRDTLGNIVSSDPIRIPGTLVETTSLSPGTHGFTLVGCETDVTNPVLDSKQRYITAITAAGITYAIRDVDQWDGRVSTGYRITFDGQVQVLSDRYDYVPRHSDNVTSVRLIGASADASLLLTMTIARDFYDDADDNDPGIFKSMTAANWASWIPNSEQISQLFDPALLDLTATALNPVVEAVYISNNRLVVETAVLDPTWPENPTGNYLIQDFRQRDNGIIEPPIVSPLPAGESILPLSPLTRPGFMPYFYTVSQTGTTLSLYQVDSVIEKLGASVTLPGRISGGSAFVRNVRDASLLIKTDGRTGLIWLRSLQNANGGVTGLRAPVLIPDSTLGRPLFVSSSDAVAWLNEGAPVDIANGGVVPLARISHYSVARNGDLTVSSLTSKVPPILGRYVTVPSPLSGDPATEGWYISTFEKTAARTAMLRTYILRTSTTLDTDRDGLLDLEEQVYGTDPTNIDSDGDGIPDGREIYPYYLISGSFTYEQARQDAIRRGGWLAVTDSAAKQDVLRRLFGALAVGNKNWMGGGDIDGQNEAAGTREGQYRWIDESGSYFNDNGAPIGALIVPPTLWAPGHPSNSGNADGLVLRPDHQWEMAPLSNKYGYILQFPDSNPAITDTDGDELTDYEEVKLGTNPNLVDTDGDGVYDPFEVAGYSWDVQSGQFIRNGETGFTSNPLLTDSDGDGIDDGDEVRLYLTNPLLGDTDNDGLTDFEEVTGSGNTNPLISDTDGDGFTDYEEVTAIPPSDPNDPSSRPGPGQLVPPNPNMHDQVEFVRQQDDVAIPASFSPFGNRSDYNRYGDDGSAMLLDVNGVLLWQDAQGVVRTVPGSEYAIPLMVSGNEAIVWINAFDPARILATAADPVAIEVGVYRVDPVTGTVGAPTLLPLEGTDILPTAPITTTTEAYTLITFNHWGIPTGSEASQGTDAFVYRMTFAGNAQLTSQIHIPNYDERLTAVQKVRALGHGSDGSVVFSIDATADFSIASPNNPDDFDFFRGNGGFSNFVNAEHRRIFAVNGSLPGPAGVVAELSAGTRIANLGDGSATALALYTSSSRVVYRTSATSGVKDARRNSITGALSSDVLLPLPVNFGAFLQMSTQTRTGDIRWFYATSADGAAINVYRLSNTGLDLVYTAVIPVGYFLDSSAVVSKINPLDGSAIIVTNSENMLWVFNNQRPGVFSNAVQVLNTLNARPIYVHRNELVVWGNAANVVNNTGTLNNVEIRHYEQKDGNIVNPTNGYSNLSSKIGGRYVLDTPPFTPDFSQWTLSTLEKASPTLARFRNYRLTTYKSLDSDADGLPDQIEVAAGSNANIADSDDDGLNDSDELYPYYIIDGSFTWKEATADAAARGGRLAVIANHDDYTAMKFRFKSLTSFDLWLGATDEVTEVNWINVDGTALNLTNWKLASPVLSWSIYYSDAIQIRVPWAVGKPDNFNNADGLVMRTDLAYEDRPVTERRGYLIEYSRTNPNNPDSDGDGIEDGAEIENGTDPSVGDPFSGVPTMPDDNGFPYDYVDFTDKRVATSYEGLVFDPEQGHVFRQKISVTTKGAFSASFNGLTSSIKGSIKGGFGLDGKTPVMPVNGLYNARSIRMWMVWNPDEEYCTIYGWIQTYQGTFIGLELRPAQYSKTNPYPLPSALTMGLPLTHAGTEGPRGDGAVTGSISNIGGVKLQMYLPDGGRLSYSGPITVGDLLPVYGISNSRNKSAVIGPVNFASTRSDRDFEGFVRFYSASGGSNSQYPAGFEQSRTVWGSRYYAPPKGYLPVTGIPATAYNTLYNLTGGDFGGITKVGTWAPTNKITIPTSPVDKASVSFSTKTGLLTYKYTLTDPARMMNKAVATGYAVTIQKSAAISGFYTSSFSNGFFNVTPGDGTIPEITQITPTSKDLRGPGGTYEIEVRTSGPWEIIVPSTDTWVQATITSGGLVVDPTDPLDPTTGTASTVKGSGPGTVQITVNSNATWQQRETKIEIAGIQHKIKQDYRD